MVEKKEDNKETPPRAWGRQKLWLPNETTKRNTPTCVGKTVFLALLNESFQKHPHVRGEDGMKAIGQPCEAETPPRAWGRQKAPHEEGHGGRNTPTCVGKTCLHIRQGHVEKKHPHVRGEDNIFEEQRNWFLETPPRAWGRPTKWQPRREKMRNTPTCVGKTASPSPCTRP